MLPPMLKMTTLPDSWRIVSSKGKVDLTKVQVLVVAVILDDALHWEKVSI